MTRCNRIATHLLANGVQHINQIADGIGETRANVRCVMRKMCEYGKAERVAPGMYGPGPSCGVDRRKLASSHDPEARKAARREWQRTYDAARGARRCAERKAARLAVKAIKPRPTLRLVASQPVKPAPVPLMSSAEWLAANPTHRIEVIAPGIVSERNRFKHIGAAA